MKRITLTTILTVVCLGAVEITVLGGGNYQKWNTSLTSLADPQRMTHYNYDGFGFHTGGLVSIGFTKRDAPVFFGLESGLRYTQIRYAAEVDSFSVTYHGDLVTLPRMPAEYNYYNLTIPAVLEIIIPEGDWFRWGVGVGPSLIITPADSIYISEVYHEIYGDYVIQRRIDLGFEAKAVLKFRVWKKLWLGPSASIIYNVTPYKAHTPEKDQEQFIILSLGAALKL